VKDGGDQFLKQWKIPERSTDGKKRRLGWQGKVQAGSWKTMVFIELLQQRLKTTTSINSINSNLDVGLG